MRERITPPAGRGNFGPTWPYGPYGPLWPCMLFGPTRPRPRRGGLPNRRAQGIKCSRQGVSFPTRKQTSTSQVDEGTRLQAEADSTPCQANLSELLKAYVLQALRPLQVVLALGFVIVTQYLGWASGGLQGPRQPTPSHPARPERNMLP
jgi:hypothetical protein